MRVWPRPRSLASCLSRARCGPPSHSPAPGGWFRSQACLSAVCRASVTAANHAVPQFPALDVGAVTALRAAAVRTAGMSVHNRLSTTPALCRRLCTQTPWGPCPARAQRPIPQTLSITRPGFLGSCRTWPLGGPGPRSLGPHPPLIPTCAGGQCRALPALRESGACLLCAPLTSFSWAIRAPICSLGPGLPAPMGSGFPGAHPWWEPSRTEHQGSSHSAGHGSLQERPQGWPSQGSIPCTCLHPPLWVTTGPGRRLVQGRPAQAQPSWVPPGRDERPEKPLKETDAGWGLVAMETSPNSSQTAVCATDEHMGRAVSGTCGEPWEGLSAGALGTWSPSPG